MKFTINKINVFNKILQIPVPNAFANQLDELIQKNAEGKNLVVSVDIERNHRSLTANGYMWLVLQFLAMHQHTTKEELYIWYLQQHGIFDFLGVLEGALPRLKTIYRVVQILGRFKTAEGVELVRVKVYPGSSAYDSKEFAYLLERILEDAKEAGFKPLADESITAMIESRSKGETNGTSKSDN